MKYILVVIAVLCASATAHARTLEVTLDTGGSLDWRLEEVKKLRATDTAVVISGQCHSSCTMYLALPKTCVTPEARLGFHGPRTAKGSRLPTSDFKYWTDIMAAHYPPQIARRFMRDWRHKIANHQIITGTQAIVMGARPCAQQTKA